ncbi:MAG: cysteine--tRNA ligase [Candidatus Komeilibacteria bacterium RIFCSPHIGHO2_01_FULL_52_14]|uniref:Cysteine--tRNA ligase n=1 Tax=Candidatus Komeilibacteria bacterium RIFCSPHIGHO2_01_FULL_52_14 TaxID=1798549 RepID=A0A1G2BKK4_9BACT|nr:MAG: cysteine--tRNA ligase [Candidatus Komeilibacteria bacterium RIFCSPHIGHO2_01_FULL_52_14]
MTIKLYNTLTRKKTEFVPIVPGHVGLYTCGPTVYDYQHIGNMRAYITWDILKRFFLSQRFDVTHVMNVTDVGHLTSDADEGEDKLELAKKRERLSAWDVASKYFDYFREDLERVNILPPTFYAKATDFIDDQIAFTKRMEERGFLYRTSDGMYFDTSKVPNYGKIGSLDVKGLMAGKRVALNPEKKNATDFAVWKFSPKDSKRDMEWDSPWGKGFPGWHLECSVISRKFLGDTFDIHTGGIDHATVHHPNEMAQTWAVTNKEQARFWLHNNFINFKDKKMSKSAGTFVRLVDMITGGVGPLSYRYFVMQTHYRKEIAYSWEAIRAADQGLKNIYRELSFYGMPDNGCEDLLQKFNEALADDLNTAKALDLVQKVIGSKSPSGGKLRTLFMMDEVLGLRFRDEWERRRNLPHISMALLEEREKARKNRDWARADAIRKKLLDYRIEVKDTNEGQQAALTE